MKKIIVIKIGTSLLTNESGKLDKENLANLVSQITYLNSTNQYHCIIVTSGAITCGSEVLDIQAKTIPEKQAAAAIGQYLLMNEYGNIFSKNNIKIGQILLTKDGIQDTLRKENIKNTIQTLLKQNIVPVINENDSVATDEICFGDNDELSSEVSVLINADKLILLTDQDGLYNKNPSKFSDATILSGKMTFSTDLLKLAEGPRSSKSRGGMKSKLLSAHFATKNGVETTIANGRRNNIIIEILKDENIGTTFIAN